MKHPLRFLAASAFALLALIVTIGVVSQPSGSAPAPGSPPAVTGTYDHAQLQRDAVMTQQMSTPNASGPMQDGRVREGQLQRSQDPAYVGALEQHEADIDRMLARNH